MEIRAYQNKDERGWVRCRVLSFLDTAYYDNVLREKEFYENPSIELVAIEDGQVVGLIDIEYEVEAGTVCSKGKGQGGMIWHIAVHPDHQRKGIGHQLLKEAESIAREKGLSRLEAWTRDDDWVNNWYEKTGFNKTSYYYHVHMEGQEELKQAIESKNRDLIPILGFAHYVGEDVISIKEQFKRVHECNCYVKEL